MLQQDTPGRSETFTHDPLLSLEVGEAGETRGITTKQKDDHEKDHNMHFDDDKGSAYVVPTKGSDVFGLAANCSEDDSSDNYDAKTATTITSEFLTTDGLSAAGGRVSCGSSHQERQDEGKDQRGKDTVFSPHSNLDWSFLRDGELFDRHEQQERLLDVFHRQMNMGAASDGSNHEYVDYDSNDDENVDKKSESEAHKVDQRSQSIRSNGSNSSFGINSLRRKTKEFVIVSGLSGTGKTILVEETLKRHVVQRGGYFLCGKLDQLNKGKSSPQRPYAPFVGAFSNFVDSVVMKTDVAEEIRASVGSKMTIRDIDILLETFPSLSRIMRSNELDNIDGCDCTRSKNKMNGADNQTQLARVVRIFLEIICDPQTRPIVLLVDDIQWADQGTLLLLHSLLSKNEGGCKLDDGSQNSMGSNGLLLVATCRHNEVTVEDELAKMLRSLEDEEHVAICQIEVTNLSRPVCGELVARVLGIHRQNYTPELALSLGPLVDIAFEQTKGNAFFLLQFIRSLHDEGFLVMQKPQPHMQKHEQDSICPSDNVVIDDEFSTNDLSEISTSTGKEGSPGDRKTDTWLWSEIAIRRSSLHDAARVTEDAVSILTHQMERLPPHVQETLKVASCLGSHFDEQVLHRAMPITANEKLKESQKIILESLVFLIKEDFLKINARSGHYRFCHDKIQQAAIALIGDHERALFCTNVGRRILNYTGSSKGSEEILKRENIFLIVNLFSHGISEGIIIDRSERMMVAALALEAGESAASMSDFVTASTYLSLGINCLKCNYVGIKNGYWKDEYDFSLTIYNAAAEVEYCTANFERMDHLIKEILLNAREFHDKMRAYITMIYSLGSRSRLLDAIAQGFSLLEVLGERFHSNDLKVFLLCDLIKTKKMLKKFDDNFERLPRMTDRDKLAAMEILKLVFGYCIMLKHPKAPFAIFRMVQLTMKHGFTASSATGFAGYGLLLCALGDYVNGNRNGKIALRLVDHFDAKELIPRVYCLYYAFISNWNRPLAMNLESLMDGHKMGLSTGDIEFAMVNACMYATNSFHAGQSLDVIEPEIEKIQGLTILFGQTAGTTIVSPILQQVYNLRAGKEFCKIPWVLSGKACDEEILMGEANASNNVMCLSQFYFRKLWMAYVFHNYEVAFKMAKMGREAVKSSPASFAVYSYHFFEGMTCMALAKSPNKKLREKKKYVRLAKNCLKTMKKAAQYCKSNCLNKFLMLEAEVLVTKGELSAGLKLFEKSASISEEEGFVHEQAIAYERAGLAILYGNQLSSNDLTFTACSKAAGKYFTRSMSLYKLWGATTKVDEMMEQGHKPE